MKTPDPGHHGIQPLCVQVHPRRTKCGVPRDSCTPHSQQYLRRGSCHSGHPACGWVSHVWLARRAFFQPCGRGSPKTCHGRSGTARCSMTPHAKHLGWPRPENRGVWGGSIAGGGSQSSFSFARGSSSGCKLGSLVLLSIQLHRAWPRQACGRQHVLHASHLNLEGLHKGPAL